MFCCHWKAGAVYEPAGMDDSSVNETWSPLQVCKGAVAVTLLNPADIAGPYALNVISSKTRSLPLPPSASLVIVTTTLVTPAGSENAGVVQSCHGDWLGSFGKISGVVYGFSS